MPKAPILLTGLLASVVCAAAVTVKVPVPSGIDNADARLVLHVDELKFAPNESGIVRVFADMPSANSETNIENEHFLGYFTILARNSAEAQRGIQRKSVTLDISDKKPLLAGKKEVTITLVPVSERPGSSESRRFSIGRAYLANN